MREELCANPKTGVRIAMVHEHDIKRVMKKILEKTKNESKI